MAGAQGSISGARFRPIAVPVVAAGLLLALGAVGTGRPALLFLALPLLVAPIAALAALPSGAPGPLRYPLRWSARGTGAEVDIEGTVEAGEAGRSLALRFARPAGLEERAPPFVRRDGGTIRFRLEWRARDPLIELLPPPAATLIEPLDLAERPVELDGPPLPVERFPPEAARVRAIPYRRTTWMPGEAPSRSLGASGEFFGVRYAVPGDSPRRSNARASARLGRWCVNEFRPERTGDLLIVLDARPSPLGPDDDRALFAIGRAAAHGIAGGFLDAKDRVGVAVFGEYLDAVPLGSGRTHRHRIRRLLDASGVAGEAGPAERLAVSLRRVYPVGVTTLLISPLGGDDSFHLLPHLRQRGFGAVVLSPSPVPRLVAGLSGRAEDRALARLIRLTRRARVARSWEEAPTLDWEDHWNLGGLEPLLRSPRPAGGLR